MLTEENCIYFHTNPKTNQVFYVGIGSKKRAYKKCGRNKWWHNIVNKYGYFISIIESDLTWNEAIEREKYYIQLFGRRDLRTGSLVNLTDGGEGALGTKGYWFGKKRPPISEQTRTKMSLASKGRRVSEKTKEKLRIIHSGKKLSKEHIDKIRKTKIGKPSSPESKRKMSISIKSWWKKKKKEYVDGTRI